MAVGSKAGGFDDSGHRTVFYWFTSIAPKEEIDKFTVGRYVFDEEDGPLGPQYGGPGRGSGKMFVEVTSQKLRELGGEILTETVTDEILTQDGKVIGVKAHNAEGELEFSCQAVILALRRLDPQ